MRTYTPLPEDVGHSLRFECAPAESDTGVEVCVATTLVLGARVIAAPQAPPRRLVPLVPETHRAGRFTVLTYNVLADLYASVRALVEPSRRSRTADLSLCSSPPGGFVRQLLPQLGVVLELPTPKPVARDVELRSRHFVPSGDTKRRV